MIVSSEQLEQFEARYQREAFAGLGYEEALCRFSALWAEALILRSDVGSEWEVDLESDLAVARAVNGLPPSP